MSHKPVCFYQNNILLLYFNSDAGRMEHLASMVLEEFDKNKVQSLLKYKGDSSPWAPLV